jgi:hypothetical protein
LNKKVDAHDGVGEKAPNDSAAQPCGKEKVITIDFIKENCNISK